MTRRTLNKTNMSRARSIIDFLSGWPNPKLFPPLLLKDAASDVLTDPVLTRESLKYAPDAGYLPLRQSIATWLNQFYGPKNGVSYERICITGGASQNLACILQAFTDPVYTRNCWLIAPSYFLACRCFDDSGFAGRLKAVPEDDEGVDIDYLAEKIDASERQAIKEGNLEPKFKSKYPWRKTYKHIIYGVPTFANPSGKLMSLRRREQLVALARRYDALLVTDDVYDMLQWPSQPQPAAKILHAAYLPRLVDIDSYLEGGPVSEWGNALSNGSFSKIVAPGCRTGWAEATPKLAWALSQCGSSRSGGAPSALVAAALHRIVVGGDLDKHIHQKLIPAYEERFWTMKGAIDKYLVPLGATMSQLDESVAGGYFFWISLPKELNAEIVRQRVLEDEGVELLSGPRFKVEGDEENAATRFEHEIRLCFAYEDLRKIEEGVRRVAKVVESLTAKLELGS